jgi:glyoxylase-like metal-dependent hydrolase (beta-lactamase superfamily II)
VLIDTGEGFSSQKYVKFLLETVFPLTKTKNISLILLTHGHADHLGGVTTLLEELKKLCQPSPKVFKRQVLNGKYSPVGFVCEHIADGQCFNASENSNSESIEIKAVYSAGHTDDHVAFTLQVKSNRTLRCVLHAHPLFSISPTCVRGIESSRFLRSYFFKRVFMLLF